MLKQLQTNENNQPLIKCTYTLQNPCNWQLEKQHARFSVIVSLRTNSVRCTQSMGLLMCNCFWLLLPIN